MRRQEAPLRHSRRRAAVLLAFALAALPAFATEEPTCDLLFAGGRVVDGTGAPWFRADVCVVGDRVARVGWMPEARARRRVDASRLVVAPGFIDMMGQS
jgi:N-acyl-D-amino-acid deacylase